MNNLKSVGLTFCLVLLFSGCGVTQTSLIPYQIENGSKMSYSLSTDNSISVPHDVLVSMDSQLKQGLLNKNKFTKGNSTLEATVLIKEYRMRPNAARLTVGIFAGCDTLKSEVVITNKTTNKVVGKSEFKSKVCEAWGVSSQVIKAHMQKIIAFL